MLIYVTLWPMSLTNITVDVVTSWGLRFCEKLKDKQAEKNDLHSITEHLV